MSKSMSFPSHRSLVLVFLIVVFLLLVSSSFFFFLRSSSHLLRGHGTTGRNSCEGYSKEEEEEGEAPLVPRGYIDYMYIFYCVFGSVPFVGYVFLLVWLLVLFYLLGNTASQYFCSTLERLSKLLHLSPAVAGVTLLSLGNGAADVFASIVSFSSSGVAEVGLSSMIGSSFFVSSVVVGVIGMSVGGGRHGGPVYIDKQSFIRDAGFLVITMVSLAVILLLGKIGFWGSVCFVSLYLVYVLVVSATCSCGEVKNELEDPLLDGTDLEEQACDRNHKLNWFIYLLEMPLSLPRRITIPDISEQRWSKPFAVASVFFSPLLLAALWNSQTHSFSSQKGVTTILLGGLFGVILGIIVLETTETCSPPKKCLFLWLAGGFLMSVTWTYITARELVAILVSIAYILRIKPSVLGLTVLAWGNSTGDLMANVAMALNCGQNGIQIAISGCYAGPVFNILVGLGLPLVFSTWSVYPSSFVIPDNSSLLETLGFAIGGLLWAMVMLPWRGMKLDKVLGVGLLALYLCFLSERLFESMGVV